MFRCEICGDDSGCCDCCQGCGHICPLERGELFCPVCKPEPESSSPDKTG